MKVIKEFNGLQKGTELSYNEAQNIYEYCSRIEGNGMTTTKYYSFSPELVASLETAGFLINEKESDSSNKLEEIQKLISTLEDRYRDTLTKSEQLYNEGKMQTCVKVESDTVNYNLLKVLREIQNIIEK